MGGREEDQSGEHGEVRVDSTVKEGGFQGKGEQARRASLGKVKGSMSGAVEGSNVPFDTFRSCCCW